MHFIFNVTLGLILGGQQLRETDTLSESFKNSKDSIEYSVLDVTELVLFGEKFVVFSDVSCYLVPD